MKNNEKKLGFNTRAIHSSSLEDSYGSLNNPIYQTSTFIFDNAKQGGRRFALEEDGYIYSRLGNPSSSAIEMVIANLENAEAAVATGSGMGAITSAIWPLIEQGDHIVSGQAIYGCAFSFLKHGLGKFGVDITFVDTSDLDAVKNAMRENTKIVYIETPANPHLLLSDIEAISEIAHKVKGCQLIVDNTFSTPYLQKPLDLGADIVVHSATKYLNGHGDVIAGFVAGRKDYIQEVALNGVKDMTGSVLGPFDAFLVERGIKTLGIRMDKHCSNAQEVAEFLESHPAVELVNYPGLKSFKQYDLAKKQMSQPGGMISFELKGGVEDGIKLLDSLKLCRLTVSLGDTRTLIEHPASMTHSPYTKEERQEVGIRDGFIRLSVGLEDSQDIISDLAQGLDSLI